MFDGCADLAPFCDGPEASESDTESLRLPPRRRLVIRSAPQLHQPDEQVDSRGEALFVPEEIGMRRGSESLDMVDITEVFSVRAVVMKSVPRFLAGAFRGALKAGLQEICKGRAANNVVVEERGWKFLLLILQLLLWRLPRGGLVPRGRLSMLERALEAAMQGKEAQCRRRRTQKDTLERRVVRAMGLAQLCELSKARHALEGEAVAPGTEDTRKVLTDKKRRLPVARKPIGNDILGRTPDVPLDFDVDRLLKNLREARKGSAAGPSGMTSEHLKPLLESVECSRLFGEVATQFARGEMSEEILRGIKMGRMTALQKRDGGVCGIVVGDVVRRLVARTIAQQPTPFTIA